MRSGVLASPSMYKTAADCSLAFVLIGTLVSMACFQVAIQTLIRVQLRRVAGKIKDLNLSQVFCQP
jgi:hypothetical protein